MNYIIFPEQIVIRFDNNAPVTITKSSSINLYNKVLEALKNNDEKTIKNLLDTNSYKNRVQEVNDFFIKSLEQSNISPSLFETIKRHHYEGLDTKFLLNFLEKLKENSSNRVYTKLFDFIEESNKSGGFTITNEGNIIAYKKVRSDFKDIYTGTFDNSPGKVVSIPRNEVDEDMYKTCSYGLHVCAFSYLEHFGSNNHESDKIVIVEVDPKNVVAIPSDYKNAKMRVCEYKVIGIYKDSKLDVECVPSIYTKNEEYVDMHKVLCSTITEHYVRTNNRDIYQLAKNRKLMELIDSLFYVHQKTNGTFCIRFNINCFNQVMDCKYAREFKRTQIGGSKFLRMNLVMTNKELVEAYNVLLEIAQACTKDFSKNPFKKLNYVNKFDSILIGYKRLLKLIDAMRNCSELAIIEFFLAYNKINKINDDNFYSMKNIFDLFKNSTSVLLDPIVIVKNIMDYYLYFFEKYDKMSQKSSLFHTNFKNILEKAQRLNKYEIFKAFMSVKV